MTRPALYNSLDQLAAAAAQLLAARRANDPAQVGKGKITADQAAIRLRIMTAIADQWRIMRAGDPFACQHDRYWATGGREGARADEMISTLEAALAGATARHHADPDDTARLELACAIEALLWWQRPAAPGHVRPAIARLHDTTIALRPPQIQPARKEAA